MRISLAQNETNKEFLQSVEETLSSKSISFEKVFTIEIRNEENNVKIDRIPKELFSNMFLKLRSLSIYSASIKEITADDLMNATELTGDLTVSESKISKLAAGIFQIMKLKTLHLSSNKIAVIEDFTFTNMGSLLELHLNENKLTKIAQNTFAGLIELTVLNLSENEIHTIEADAFTELQKLRTLVLNQNKLKQLDDNIYNGFNHLSTLQVGSNQIENIDVLYTMDSLENVGLGNNSIADVDLVAFAKLPKLHKLNLFRNQLNLENIYVDPDFSSTSELSVLGLASTGVSSEADLEVLRIFPKLKDLDLRDNPNVLRSNISKESLSSFLPELEILYL